MDFQISDDRRMLADTLRRYLSEQYGIEHRNRVAYEAPWHDPSKWTDLAELGLFHAFASEDHGGMGGAGFDIAVVFEELGRALCPEPVLGQLMAIRLIGAAGGNLAPLLDGTHRYAVGLGELDSPYDLSAMTTRADGTALTGRKSVVYGGGAADRLLIATHDLGLWQIAATDAEIASYGMIDGGPAAEVFVDNTPATLRLADARAAIAEALDWGALALCAEALGAMEAAYGMLVDYLGTRRQFGKPIGSFQALQHRAVDLSIEIEQARSIVILAAAAMDTPDRARRASQAKHLVGRIARQVAEEVIQMHGGIAMTWEYPASHYAKRLVMIDHQLGDTDWHLERLMDLLQAERTGP